MINLWFAIMFMAMSIAMVSAREIDDSFGRRFNSSWFWKIAAQPTFILCLYPSVEMWWLSGKFFWMLRNFSRKVMGYVLVSLVRYSFTFGWFIVYGAVLGRIVLCIIFGLILMSVRRV